MAAAHGQVAVDLRMSANPVDLEAARELIQRTAMLLDEEKFDAWVELFDTQGTYELSAYSTEIRRWMTWQLSDRETLQKLLKEVDEHVRDPARRRHIVGIPLVELDGDSGHVTSHFSLFRTSPEGQSSLYMVGCYDDRIVKRASSWRYATHKVIVDTRMLDSFTHIPV
jgi:3-phenylpropionate/cinnamic acid dioxygenase small subunit